LAEVVFDTAGHDDQQEVGVLMCSGSDGGSGVVVVVVVAVVVVVEVRGRR
jgi:hypothetical protein